MSKRAKIADVRPRHVNIFLGKTEPVTRSWHSKYSRVRGFFRYAVSRGFLEVSPLPNVIAKQPPPFVPYIYSREELRRLLDAVESEPQKNGIGAPTIRILVLTLYGAGLRLREAMNLTCGDVNLQQSLLTIRNTKFGKTRFVPVGPQLSEALSLYAKKIQQVRPPSAEAPFFITRTGGSVLPDTFQRNYRILCDDAGIRRTDCAEQPRIHDLRHTFAVHRLTSWYRQGADVQRLLPLLSVYLGHVHIRHTQVYLSMTPDLLQQASQRFENYAAKDHHHD
ncbi:MAG: tyrosine-type recombinase/integrase [Planctomycetaceae bacterium]|nr:tyrosine-type recombinase/integrase [Planctomycetaceae bacterium]